MMDGIVFDIQHYAIYDGPGIRTLIFFKGCPLRCKWCQNPESQQFGIQIFHLREKCKICGTCITICPTKAIQISKEGFESDNLLCNGCKACMDSCPNEAIWIVGKKMNSIEILEEILVDQPFFQTSGGGITVSGGEPTSQSPFLIELLSEMKNRGIHTAIETCGAFSHKLLFDLLPVVDLFLFDLKIGDSSHHKEYTGADNETIIRNFREIVKIGSSKRVIPRIPLIPNINLSLETIASIVNILKNAGYSGSVHLMPYNRYSKSKYEKFGLNAHFQDFGEISGLELEKIVNYIEQEGFEVMCNH